MGGNYLEQMGTAYMILNPEVFVMLSQNCISRSWVKKSLPYIIDRQATLAAPKVRCESIKVIDIKKNNHYPESNGPDVKSIDSLLFG